MIYTLLFSYLHNDPLYFPGFCSYAQLHIHIGRFGADDGRANGCSSMYHVCVFGFVLLVGMPVSVPAPYCFSYNGTVMCPEIWNGNPFSTAHSAQDYFDYLRVSWDSLRILG